MPKKKAPQSNNGNSSTAGAAGTQLASTRGDLQSEKIIGMLTSLMSFQKIFNEYARALPRYIDDAERDFGYDIYERMMRDPIIASSIETIKMRVLASGVKYLSRVQAPSEFEDDPEAQARYDKAESIRAEIEKMMGNLQQPIEDILYEMLDSLAYGHSVAEQTYSVDKGKLILSKLRVKPRRNYYFVANSYMDLIGLIGYTDPGGSMITSLSGYVTPEKIIPREKFFVLTMSGNGGDPRGSSILRRAYNSWYLKQQAWAQYFKYCDQFATPSIAAIAPPDAQGGIDTNEDGTIKTNPDGTPVEISIEQLILNAILPFRNGTAIVLPAGSEFNVIEMQGDGSVYINAINLHDNQMTRGILLAARATMEAEHGSRADSETAQDIVDTFAEFIAHKVESQFYRDVILPLVRYNYGDEVANSDLVPYIALTNVAKEDVIDYGNMVANLGRTNLIDDSQLPGIDAKLGLPKRDMEARRIEKEEQAAQQKIFDLNLMDMQNLQGEDRQNDKKNIKGKSKDIEN